MQLTSKEKTLLYILALVAALVVCVQFIVMPMYQNYTDLKLELGVKQEEKFQMEQTLARAGTIDQEIEDVLIGTSEVSVPFFTPVEVEYLHKWIVSMAAQSGVTINSLNLGGKSAGVPTAYAVTDTLLTYPIGDSYHNMVNATSVDAPVQEVAAEATPVEAGKDAVIQDTINVSIKGSKENIIKFVDQLEALNKYVLVQNFALGAFDQAEEQETSVSMTLYSIHKENDGIFNFEF